MSYLDVAELVDNDIVKAGKWHFDQVEGESNSFGYVRIATGDDRPGRRLFSLIALTLPCSGVYFPSTKKANFLSFLR